MENEPTSDIFVTYLGNCLKNFHKEYIYLYNHHLHKQVPVFSDKDIEQITDSLKDLKWRYYLEPIPHFPNPLTVIEIAKEISLEIPYSNIPQNMREFLEKEDIRPFQLLYRSYVLHKNAELAVFIERDMEKLHPNIQTIYYDEDYEFLISSRIVSEEIAYCLRDLSRLKIFNMNFKSSLNCDIDFDSSF